jgi:alkylresorcinol/alkylpyrone synthase
MSDPRLLALATAVPPYALKQSEVRQRAQHLFAGAGAGGEVERLLPVFLNAGIDTRYSCVPIDWYDEPPGWKERNRIYLESAVDLLERVTLACLDQAGLGPEAIDAIIVVSTTGIATPSLDALLMERLAMRRDVDRLPVFGLGCAGGVLGLSRAAAMARERPGRRVLYLVVELCALCFRKGDFSKSNIVATALFGDGAAGAILSSEGDGPRFGPGGQHTWRQSLDIMGWAVEPDGLRAIFSRDIPAFVRAGMRDATAAFLERNGLGLGDIDAFVCHPGGAKVLSALEEAFEIGDGALAEGRSVLRDYGNMSAATVCFVLERTLRAPPPPGPPQRMLMTAMGPGFTAGFQVLDRR